MRTAFVVALLLMVSARAAAQPATPDLPSRYALQSVIGTPSTDTLDGPIATAQVRGTPAMAIAPDGALYFTDGASIRRVAAGIVTTVAGVAQRSGSADGPAAFARFSTYLAGLAVAADGTVFVADTLNHTIRRLTTDGMVSTVAGVPGASGLAHGRRGAARFALPYGVAVDHTGTVYVVDRNCTLRRINSAGDVQLMATLATPCFTLDNHLPPLPVYRGAVAVAVAVDASRTVYVAMVNYTVSRVTQAGVVTTLAGRAGVNGNTDGPAGTGRLNTLRSITVTPGGAVRVLESFIWDAPGNNAQFHGQNAIREIAPDGTISTVRTLEPRTGGVGTGVAGLAVDASGASYAGNHETGHIDRVAPDGTLAPWIGAASRDNDFTHLAADATGAIMTTGVYTRQVRRIGTDGTLGALLYSTGYESHDVVRSGSDFYFDDGPTLVRLAAGGSVSAVVTFTGEDIRDLAAAPDGTLVAYLRASSTARRIVRITPQGAVTTLAGGLTADAFLTVSATTGDIYFSDRNVIRRMTADGTITVAAGVPGAVRGTVDGGPAQARLVEVTRLHVLADGTIYFIDGLATDAVNYWTGAVLRQVTPSGDVLSLWSGRPASLSSLTAAGNGDLYVAYGGAIYRATPVTAAPLAITTQPVSTAVQAGASASFAVEATGGGTPVVRWMVSTDGGSTWSALADPPAAGAAEARLTLHHVSRSMHGYRYRATLTDADETLVSDAVTLSVTGMVTAPETMRFTAIKNGAAGDLVHVTPGQTMMISFTSGAPAWTASSSVPWIALDASSTTGMGAGLIRVAISNPSNTIGAATALTGAVTITPVDETMPAITVPVQLTIIQSSTVSTLAPIGQVDTPAQNATDVVGAIGVTGWALDDVGVASVKIYRRCIGLDNPASCQTILGQNVVFVGDAAFLTDARPDVEAAFPAYPSGTAAGWGMQILTNMLPHIPNSQLYGGQGALTLFVYVTDVEGHVRLLGRSYDPLSADYATPTDITISNDTIAKPFGTIDTPALGETISGMVANFGWVLTPDSNTTAGEVGDILMTTSGAGMVVYIDGVATATVAYNQCRGTVGNPPGAGVFCNDDIANIFGNATPQATLTARTSNPTRFRNLDAMRSAIGAYVMNTTTMTNGRHQIAWGVADSAARGEGIGSRFFTVLNSGADATARAATPLFGGRTFPGSSVAESRSGGHAGSEDPASEDRAAPPIYGRTGYALDHAWKRMFAGSTGAYAVRLPEAGRLELWLGEPADAGYLVANGTLRPLPVGATLAGSYFAWMPPVGYVGPYTLAFVRGDERIDVTVTVAPVASTPAGTPEVQMFLDPVRVEGPVLSPSTSLGAGERSVRVEGWAFDPKAAIGSGMGAVHVWAKRVPGPGSWVSSPGGIGGASPIFLGAANLDIARPDVAFAHPGASGHAGYQLTATLGAGTWELTAYVWNDRTARWEDARTTMVTIR